MQPLFLSFGIQYILARTFDFLFLILFIVNHQFFNYLFHSHVSTFRRKLIDFEIKFILAVLIVSQSLFLQFQIFLFRNLKMAWNIDCAGVFLTDERNVNHVAVFLLRPLLFTAKIKRMVPWFVHLVDIFCWNFEVVVVLVWLRSIHTYIYR